VLTDLDEEALWAYRSPLREPQDFAGFWDRTLHEARRHPMRPQERDVATPLTALRVRDVTFPVFGAYHAYAGPKQMVVWPFNGHESGGAEDTARALAHVAGVLGARSVDL
jgi:cephalosporin-C deacetylase-like acetyl esterase